MYRRGPDDSLVSRRLSGFTLMELLVVILIAGIVAVLVGPVLFHGSMNNREAARLLHGALAGARDAAIGHNAPRGIRLMPDPSIPIRRLANNQVDPSALLCASRIVPIEPGPDYSEGRVSIGNAPFPPPPGFPPSYLGSKTDVYPCYWKVLMVEECPSDPKTGLLNSPTSWFWNVRIGDRIRLNDTGSWYTVVGPMTTPNEELFVNCGTPGVDFPGKKSPLKRFYGRVVEVEFLFLVNGRDDNGNGYIDEGFDGEDNNADGVIDDLGEWEVETWGNPAIRTSTVNHPYTLARRPVPSPGRPDVALPSSVVIDLSTWGTTRERSRLPVNALSGSVEILLTPRGDVVPTTIYSSPTSVGMSSTLYHFWLADRSDLFDPDPRSTPQLPLP
jgi:prepilin-type N-terminal cleavage/methylation domain-containing protein